MTDNTEEGNAISIRVPRHKRVTDYPIGSIQPLIADATKSIIGKWMVTNHYNTPMGQFVSGEIVKVNIPANVSVG